MAVSKQKYILIKIGRQTWSLPLLDSSDFFQIRNIVPLPRASDKIVGLTYHQGHIITILASDKLLGTKLVNLPQHCLRIDWQGEHYGLLVDLVGEVIAPVKITNDYVLVNKTKINILSIADVIKQLS